MGPNAAWGGANFAGRLRGSGQTSGDALESKHALSPFRRAHTSANSYKIRTMTNAVAGASPSRCLEPRDRSCNSASQRGADGVHGDQPSGQRLRLRRDEREKRRWRRKTLLPHRLPSPRLLPRSRSCILRRRREAQARRSGFGPRKRRRIHARDSGLLDVTIANSHATARACSADLPARVGPAELPGGVPRAFQRTPCTEWKSTSLRVPLGDS